ncbi:MAG: HEAT repeat domain-containing protein [Nitrospirota bacterium]|nr:HEAT repeat domain-containing protein [Nitrospirota bacterium]
MADKFQDLEHFDQADIEAAIIRNAPDEISFVPLIVALSSSDQHLAMTVCAGLATHGDPQVRGNAVMSLGHIARRFRQLDESLVKPIIERALQDQDDQVRILAKSAADEIHQFLHWTISGHSYT